MCQETGHTIYRDVAVSHADKGEQSKLREGKSPSAKLIFIRQLKKGFERSVRKLSYEGKKIYRKDEV